MGRKLTRSGNGLASVLDRELLAKVLELEWENRHLKTPDIRRTLRNFIQQVCK